MRTFLLFLPFRWLRNELFVGCLLPPFCKRDNDDVEDEKEDDGVPDRLGRRGREYDRGSSLTFSFTLNILSLFGGSRCCVYARFGILLSFSSFFNVNRSG